MVMPSVPDIDTETNRKQMTQDMSVIAWDRSLRLVQFFFSFANIFFALFSFYQKRRPVSAYVLIAYFLFILLFQQLYHPNATYSFYLTALRDKCRFTELKYRSRQFGMAVICLLLLLFQNTYLQNPYLIWYIKLAPSIILAASLILLCLSRLLIQFKLRHDLFYNKI